MAPTAVSFIGFAALSDDPDHKTKEKKEDLIEHKRLKMFVFYFQLYFEPLYVFRNVTFIFQMQDPE